MNTSTSKSTPENKEKTSLYTKVTTSVAHFFGVSVLNAIKTFVKCFEGGTPQDIMRERFSEWKEETETLDEIKEYKLTAGKRVVLNKITDREKALGMEIGHVAKVFAIMFSEDGVEKAALCNPMWSNTEIYFGKNVVWVDLIKCEVEVVE